MADTEFLSRAGYAKLIAKAWSDETFKHRLMTDPTDALADIGVAIPDGVQVQVLQDTSDKMHLVLPAAPDNGSVKDQELERISGGMTV